MSATQRQESSPFTVDVESQREVVRVCPRGEVDLATVGDVREQVGELLSAGFTRVLLDLRQVTFLDSTGLRLIIEFVQSSQADGWQFVLIDGSAPVRRVFDVTGLRDQLPFVDAGEAALPQVGRSGGRAVAGETVPD
jgi:anti-sigma B factor antagonist